MTVKACSMFLSMAPLVFAFNGVSVMTTRDARKNCLQPTETSMSALIYGWEDDSVEDTDVMVPGAPGDFGQCSPAGVAVAESLSYDQDRVGSLARLAVAFSPPERAITLDDILKVDVLCVSNDKIDIQAIICEDGGCVSLAVPIKFPYACESNDEWLEGCVRQNLEQLDESAKSTISKSSGDHIGTVDASKVDYPNWWVSPESNYVMTTECTSMRNILNEDEFKTDIIALAQSSIDHADDIYRVTEATVAAVGPAGLCFKVRASPASGESQVLDVFYPFGEVLNTVDSLRAAVLGAVATA